jgi:hypothetical protein
VRGNFILLNHEEHEAHEGFYIYFCLVLFVSFVVKTPSRHSGRSAARPGIFAFPTMSSPRMRGSGLLKRKVAQSFRDVFLIKKIRVYLRSSAV